MTAAQFQARRTFVASVMAERQMRVVVSRKPNGDLHEHATNKSNVVPFGTTSRKKGRRKMARASRRRNRVA